MDKSSDKIRYQNIICVYLLIINKLFKSNNYL